MSFLSHHGFRGTKGGSCTYTPPSTNQTCEAGESAKVHMGYAPDYSAEMESGIARAGREAGARLAKAMQSFPPLVKADQEKQHWPGSAEAVWQEHSRLVAELLATKQAYGDAWKRQGYMGNLARIMSKAARLQNMLWTDDPSNGIGASVGQESVIDTLQDLSALCALMVSNWGEGNRWGS